MTASFAAEVAQKAVSAILGATPSSFKEAKSTSQLYWDLQVMMLVRTYLSNSAIEGVGIFAAESIKAGDVIWSLEPKFDVFFTESDIEELPPHMQDFIARYSYPHMTKPGIWVLESDNGRFMNHSEAPNTDFTDFEQGFAIRDIAAGEEITCNYHEFDSSFQGWFPSLAKAANGDAHAHS